MIAALGKIGLIFTAGCAAKKRSNTGDSRVITTL